MNKQTSSSEFLLKFNGELNQINANTLIRSLSSITSVIDEINEELGNEKNIEITVKSPEKGSFLISLVLAPEFRDSVNLLINKENINIALLIVRTIINIFNLRKSLKGKKPEQIDQKENRYEIKTEKGNVLVIDKPTYNLYFTNPRVGDAIGSTFETLSNDPRVNGFEILDHDKKRLFEAKKDEFEDLSIKYDLISENNRIEIKIADLYIFKVVFEDKYKWDFYYKGNKISAKIADTDFFSKINVGEQFAKGDSLEVELQIEQVFDQTVNTFINKSYQINRVIRHKPRGTQENLEFNE